MKLAASLWYERSGFFLHGRLGHLVLLDLQFHRLFQSGLFFYAESILPSKVTIAELLDFKTCFPWSTLSLIKLGRSFGIFVSRSPVSSIC